MKSLGCKPLKGDLAQRRRDAEESFNNKNLFPFFLAQFEINGRITEGIEPFDGERPRVSSHLCVKKILIFSSSASLRLCAKLLLLLGLSFASLLALKPPINL